MEVGQDWRRVEGRDGKKSPHKEDVSINTWAFECIRTWWIELLAPCIVWVLSPFSRSKGVGLRKNGVVQWGEKIIFLLEEEEACS
ncbi:hypothetical protein TNCT_594251 [Trichonephila clavata]|uniref:Uncharacterized protein n=1 Tax=Trichonephila clavata TaxID=2740835 RepID=A0A8X6HKM9_TRICU|nr:hypothetical protein TNCT_594251 [Trichonephila clavata]